MARIRTIKPEFWTDEKITECSLSARLMLIGMLNFADDFGNLERSAKRIKMQVFPADNIETEELIVELITQGLLTEYSHNGKMFLHINGFQKHQRINRPSKPIHPLMESQGGLTEDSLTEKEKEKEKEKNKQKRFTPPTVEEVSQYCEERGNGIDPDNFIDHYQANDWMRGKSKIKDWKACVRTWEKNKSQDSEGGDWWQQ